ncbi:MAG: hypothetical protein ACRYG6_06670 [Janthinobacterium lividum]
MSGSQPTRRGLLHAGVATGGLLLGAAGAEAAVPGRGVTSPPPAGPSASLAAAQMPQAVSRRIREEFGHRLDLRAFIPASVTDTASVDCSPYIAQALAALNDKRGRLDIGDQFYLVASPILTGDYSVFIHGDGADVCGFIGTSTDAVIAHRPAADNLLGVLFGEDFSVRSAAPTPTRFGIDVKYPVDAAIVTDHEGNRGFARDGASSPTGKSASDSTQQAKPGVMLRRVKVLSNQDGSSAAASFRTALRLYGATVCLIDDFVATANPGGVPDTYGIELGGYTRAVRIESPDLENFHIAVAPTSYWEGITINRPQATNVGHLWRSPNAGTKDYVPLGIKGGSGDEVNIINAGEVVCLDTAVHVYRAFRTFISGCHLETDWRPGVTPKPVVIIEDSEETRLLDCFVVQGDPVPGRTSIAVHVTGQAGGGNQVHIHDVACRAGWIEFDDKTYFCNSGGCTALIGDGPHNDSMPAVVDHGTGNVVSYDMPKSEAPGRHVVNNLEISGTLTGAGGQVFVPSALTQVTGSGFVTTAGRGVLLPFSEALANPGHAFDTATHVYTVPETGHYEVHVDVDTAEGTPPVSQVGLTVGRATKWGNSGVHRTTIAATIHDHFDAGARVGAYVHTSVPITLDGMTLVIRRVG